MRYAVDREIPPMTSLRESAGPYRLLEEIGVGGMGEVYLALDPDGRTVAVKILHPAVARDAVARRRLSREVATMRRVRSPYVAEVLDAGFTVRRPYIVTRYVQGRALDVRVRATGPVRGPALTALARGLARALHAVHSAGIVHRDLKPGNVVLVDDLPVVIDFGLAHMLDATRLTRTGTAIGTPGYLAPEVLDGERAGPAADVFSWGATVAFAARGRSAYGAGPAQAVFSRVLRGRYDLDGVPAGLRRLVAAALRPDPEARPGTGDLLETLAARARDGAPRPRTDRREGPPGAAGEDAAGAPAGRGGARRDAVTPRSAPLPSRPAVRPPGAAAVDADAVRPGGAIAPESGTPAGRRGRSAPRVSATARRRGDAGAAERKPAAASREPGTPGRERAAAGREPGPANGEPGAAVRPRAAAAREPASLDGPPGAGPRRPGPDRDRGSATPGDVTGDRAPGASATTRRRGDTRAADEEPGAVPRTADAPAGEADAALRPAPGGGAARPEAHPEEDGPDGSRPPAAGRVLRVLLALTAPAACYTLPVVAVAATLAACVGGYAWDAVTRARRRIAARPGRLARLGAGLVAVVAAPVQAVLRLAALVVALALGYGLVLAVTWWTVVPHGRALALPLGVLAAAAALVRAWYSGTRRPGRLVVAVLAAALLVPVVIGVPAPAWWPFVPP